MLHRSKANPVKQRKHRGRTHVSVLQIIHCAVGYWSILEYEMDLDKITRFGSAPETSHSLRFSGVHTWSTYLRTYCRIAWTAGTVSYRIQVDREQ